MSTVILSARSYGTSIELRPDYLYAEAKETPPRFTIRAHRTDKLPKAWSTVLSLQLGDDPPVYLTVFTTGEPEIAFVDERPGPVAEAKLEVPS